MPPTDDAAQHRTPTAPHPTFVLVSESPRVAAPDLRRMAAALHQDQRLFCASWGRVPPVVLTAHAVQDAHPGAIVVRLVGAASDPAALAWHTEDADGRILVEVAVDAILDPGGGVLDGGTTGVSVASAIDHEIKETMIDPNVATWSDRFDGTEVAVECCDPVQGDLLPVIVHDPDGSAHTVMLSNYVLPAWFDPQAPTGARLDALGTAPAQLVLAKGGYMVLRRIGGDLPAEFGFGIKHKTGDQQVQATILHTAVVFDAAVPAGKRASILRRVGQRLNARHRVHPVGTHFRRVDPGLVPTPSHGGDHGALATAVLAAALGDGQPPVPATLPAPPDPAAAAPLAANEMIVGGKRMIIPAEAMPTARMPAVDPAAAAAVAPAPTAATPTAPADPGPMRIPDAGGGIVWAEAERCPRDRFNRIDCKVNHAHK